MSWDHWIKEKIVDVDYDRLIELAVSSYNLGKKTRKMGQKDRVQFIVVWWRDNKEKFFRYNTTTKLGALLNIDHSTVIHHYSLRKKSRRYEEETRCIKDFIKS
jgi:hypothetical protein